MSNDGTSRLLIGRIGLVLLLAFAVPRNASASSTPTSPTPEALVAAWPEMDVDTRMSNVLAAYEAHSDDPRLEAMIEELAEEGQAEAEYLMALRFADVGKRRQASRWYREVAEHDRESHPACWTPEGSCTRASFELGQAYYSGKGEHKDLAEAFTWFHEAAESGDARAQYNVAIMYKDGIGGPKNLRAFVHWIERSAAGGNPEAIEIMRRMVAQRILRPDRMPAAAEGRQRASERADSKPK
jgi:hypothetical protein